MDVGRLLELRAAKIYFQDYVHDVDQNVTHEWHIHGTRQVDVQLLVAGLVLHELFLDVPQGRVHHVGT